MIRRPPRSTRTDTLFPYTTLFRSAMRLAGFDAELLDRAQVAKMVPGLDMSRTTRFPVEGGLLQPRGGTARHDAVAWGYAYGADRQGVRSEEHTSELQSLMRISYAVFCLKKNTNTKQTSRPQHDNTSKRHSIPTTKN